MRRQDKEETQRDSERAHQVGGQPQSSQLPHAVLGWLGLLLSSAAGLEGETLHLTHSTPHTALHCTAGTCCHGDGYHGNGYHSDGYCGNGHHGDHYHSNVHESTTSGLLSCCCAVFTSQRPNQVKKFYNTSQQTTQHACDNHMTRR